MTFTIHIPDLLTGGGVLIGLLAIAVLLMVRHYDRKQQHLSVWQLIIRAIGYSLHWAQSVCIGLDAGYEEYRHYLKGNWDRPSNENKLGAFVGRVHWDPSLTD